LYASAQKDGAGVVGTDFCHEMLVRAAEKAERAEQPIPFIEADAQALPFPENTFGLVTVAFGLRNVTDYEQGLREMVRVCQPGGRVAILEFSKPRHWFFGRMYRAYFRYLLPAIGQIFCRNNQAAYKYLPESVMAFPDHDALADKMRLAGLVNVEFTAMTLGIATLYLGTKPT
jgi:demethylmenaquinone methyltransferase/2-methoxy-6-polyprenyl-1,4-benzoquinol methylase